MCRGSIWSRHGRSRTFPFLSPPPFSVLSLYFSLSSFVSPSFLLSLLLFFTHFIIVGVGTSARMYVAKRGRRSFKDGARLWRHICFIPPCQHASGLSFQHCNCVISFISLPLPLPLPSPFLAASSFIVATCQFHYSMFNMSLFYLSSQLMPLSHMHTCLQRNNSPLHFLVYLWFSDNVISLITVHLIIYHV